MGSLPLKTMMGRQSACLGLAHSLLPHAADTVVQDRRAIEVKMHVWPWRHFKYSACGQNWTASLSDVKRARPATRNKTGVGTARKHATAVH